MQVGVLKLEHVLLISKVTKTGKERESSSEDRTKKTYSEKDVQINVHSYNYKHD